MNDYVSLGARADGVLASPVRNLVGTLLFVLGVFVVSTMGYIGAGWSVSDSVYMVVLTIFSVGYEEVKPINTDFLKALTIGTMVLGCTGMIVLTGALVQFFALFQLRKMLGLDRMQTEIERLNDHVIICGYGRIGQQLAKELQAARNSFVILEREAAKAADIQAKGFLCLTADATDEASLKMAGIDRAKVLASVLPDDATNVFITLSARNLNAGLQIIARGEAPSTENKLYHAGADKVVLPTHIGAERIAELILYPSTAHYVGASPQMNAIKRGLHEFGLELEVVVVDDKGGMVGQTVGDAEQLANGAFFVVQIDRASGQNIVHPGEDVRFEHGDSAVLVVRGSRVSAGAIFYASGQPARGRSRRRPS